MDFNLNFCFVIDKCEVSNAEKVDCGQMGTNEQQCLAGGCCWQPVEPNPGNVPWCYHGNDFVDPCKSISWEAPNGPGFDDTIYNVMYKK